MTSIILWVVGWAVVWQLISIKDALSAINRTNKERLQADRDWLSLEHQKFDAWFAAKRAEGKL